MPERDLYRPFGTVQPVERTTPAINISFPEVRFSDSIGQALGALGQGRQVLGHAQEQVGAALAHMGGKLEGAGNEIFARASAIKTVQNHTAAVDAETKYRIEGGKMQEAFESTNGNAATNGLEAHMKGLEDLRQKIRGTLNNDQARGVYDQQSLHALGSMVLAAGKHGVAQSKANTIAAEKAKWELTLNDIYKDPNNPDNERRKEDARQDFMDNVAPIMGLKGPVLELELLKRESKYNSMQLSGIAKTDPTKADELLKERRGRMMAPDIENVEQSVRGGHYLRGPRIAEREINEDLYKDKTDKERENEPGLKERLQKADDWAQKYMPDDVEFRQRVRQATENGYNQEKQNRADAVNKNWAKVEKALGPSDDGKIPGPTNMEQLRARGEDVEAAVRDLIGHKKYRDAIANSFKHNIDAGKTKFDSIDSVARFGQLKGMAASDPEGFMNATEDIHNPKLGMNDTELKGIQKLRDAIRMNPLADPRVGKWMEWLSQKYGTEMDALNIGRRRTTQNAEDYDKFVGALLTDVEEFATDKHRTPTREEFLEVIGKELLNYKPGGWWPFGAATQYPAWHEAVPEEWAAGHNAKIVAGGGKELTEKEMREDYQRYIFRESLRPKAPEPPPKGKVPAKPKPSVGTEE